MRQVLMNVARKPNGICGDCLPVGTDRRLSSRYNLCVLRLLSHHLVAVDVARDRRRPTLIRWPNSVRGMQVV